MSTRNLEGDSLTQAVLASFAGTPDDRLRQLLGAVVEHLHALAVEVELTEAEWAHAIDFLTRTGQMCSDQRQELILLSDVLGLSMQVIGLNHDSPPPVTPSTVFGPFFVEGAPQLANGQDIAGGAPGEPCLVQGRVEALDRTPLGGVTIDVWQADDEGLYDVQYSDLDAPRDRAQLRSQDDGRFWFWTVKPEPYPIPEDGPVGELLGASGRSPMRPAHIHFMARKAGYEELVTHVFVAGDPYLDSDAVFGVRTPLITPFERHQPGTAADGTEMSSTYWTMRYTLVLAPSDTN